MPFTTAGHSSTSSPHTHTISHSKGTGQSQRMPSAAADAAVPDKLRHGTLSPCNERFSTDLTDVAGNSVRPKAPSSCNNQPASYCSIEESYYDGASWLTALDEPHVLQALIANMEWSDVYNILTSCRKLYDIFGNIPLRDIVLSRFVPGYAHCLRDRNMQLYEDVPVTVHDLDRLLISQRVPLHRYPIHALKMLQTIYPTMEDEQLREKFAALSQAHSRFVLLLQTLVHSSSASIPPESEEWLSSSRPRPSPIQTMRELTFPAPLAYAESQSSRPSTAHTISSYTSASKLVRHSRHLSAPAASETPKEQRTAWSFDKPRSPRPSAADVNMSVGASSNPPTLKKKISIFSRKSGRRSMPPPPPPPHDEPHALKMYSSAWRRSSVCPVGAEYDDSALLKRMRASVRYQDQRRPLGAMHANDSSDSSSLSISRSRASMTGSPGIGGGCSSSMARGPHDLILATSRIRAPVLRVFVPCTRLGDDTEAVLQCEQQLVDANLWDHLSVGDLVCNLGYVSSLEDGSSTSSEGDTGDFIMIRGGKSRSPGHTPSSYASVSAGGPGVSASVWLVFDGHMLRPYCPPDMPVPLANAVTLPTPFYYTHVIPAPANPSYIVSRMPPCRDAPQLALVHTSRKVRSPHSPRGWAIVKKYAWTASVVRVRARGQRQGAEGNHRNGNAEMHHADHMAVAEMGEGWYGEWTLEGEGTPEGKQLLLAVLRGQDVGPREWELVREKSGPGKIYMRLLTI